MIDPDIQQFARDIKEKLYNRRRVRGSNFHADDAIEQMLTHKMVKEGWKRVASTPRT